MNLRKYVIGLHKQIRRLTSFKVAYQEWSDKTDWVQQSVQSGELGKHRADAIKDRYDALKTENESLRKDAERYRWLRASDWYVGSDNFYCSEGGQMENYSNENFSPDDLDATIDAAISSPENPS